MLPLRIADLAGSDAFFNAEGGCATIVEKAASYSSQIKEADESTLSSSAQQSGKTCTVAAVLPVA